MKPHEPTKQGQNKSEKEGGGDKKPNRKWLIVYQGPPCLFLTCSSACYLRFPHTLVLFRKFETI
jgi:hypothetical protein